MIGGGDGDEPVDGGGEFADSEIEGGSNEEILYHLLELIVPSIHPLPHVSVHVLQIEESLANRTDKLTRRINNYCAMSSSPSRPWS